jgi:rhodanese-related sulfurtransferase
MTEKNISAREAAELVASGYAYIDVRSEQEFEGGHPEGAYNIPINILRGGGMIANSDFVSVVAASFAKDAPIVLGCRSGPRSQRAMSILEAAGFTHIVHNRAGFAGIPGEPGWARLGLPTSVDAEPGHSYGELASKLVK